MCTSLGILFPRFRKNSFYCIYTLIVAIVFCSKIYIMDTKNYTYKIVSVAKVPDGPYLVNFGEFEDIEGDTRGLAVSEEQVKTFNLEGKLIPGAMLTYTSEQSVDENGKNKNRIVSIIID